MKSNFLNDVISVLHLFAAQVLTLADSKRINTAKGVSIRDRLKKILKQSDAAYDLTPCQKAHLHALADPYVERINTALAVSSQDKGKQNS